MEEAAFNKELNKYRVVRRPEYVGKSASPVDTKKIAPAPSTTKKSVASSSAATINDAAKNISGNKDFWETLAEFAKLKGIPADEATKLVQAAKQLHEEKRAVKA